MEFKIGQIVLDRSHPEGFSKYIDNPSLLDSIKDRPLIYRPTQHVLISGDDRTRVFNAADISSAGSSRHGRMAEQLGLVYVFGGAYMFLDSPKKLLISGCSTQLGHIDADILEANKYEIIKAYNALMPSIEDLEVDRSTYPESKARIF